MAEINNNTTGSILQNIGLTSQRDLNVEKSKANDELGQEDFFKLLVAQYKNQDPTNPTEATDQITQMAQFSQLDAMNALNKSFDNFAASLQSNQALQASALVGHKVEVSGDQLILNEGSVAEGSLDLETSATQVRLSVYSDSGQLLRTVDMGTQAPGNVRFSWDGKDAQGNAMPAGSYRVKAEGFIDGTTQALATNVTVNVDSVTLPRGGAGEITLNLAGVGAMPISEVKRIN